MKPAFEVGIDIVFLGAARPESFFWPSKALFGPHLQKKACKFNVSGTSTSPTIIGIDRHSERAGRSPAFLAWAAPSSSARRFAPQCLIRKSPFASAPACERRSCEQDHKHPRRDGAH